MRRRRQELVRSNPWGFVLVLLLTALGTLAVAGCGDRQLIARVDLRSFLDSTETEAHYGPVPAIAGTESVTVAAGRRIDLVPGLQDVTIVEAVKLEAEGEFRNLSGSGSGIVKLFLAAPGTDPFTTSPFLLPVTFSGSDTVVVATVIENDPTLIGLFNGDELLLGIRFSITVPPGGLEPIEGDFELRELRAEVAARQNVAR